MLLSSRVLEGDGMEKEEVVHEALRVSLAGNGGKTPQEGINDVLPFAKAGNLSLTCPFSPQRLLGVLDVSGAEEALRFLVIQTTCTERYGLSFAPAESRHGGEEVRKGNEFSLACSFTLGRGCVEFRDEGGGDSVGGQRYCCLPQGIPFEERGLSKRR